MHHLLCSSSSDTFDMVLEPCSEIFLPILTLIWMLKCSFEHSNNVGIQLQDDRQSNTRPTLSYLSPLFSF
ncbi:photosystem ii cp47 reaction center protein [Phtheirospermum japonicum]|uniref:Photosystem ii cp47 reaction center protein n=1 Tax=Phtheirospermum japonicum TaxID=374723 RepID=A0A830C6K0_9LAMI|nr:photosystem ii cp47 reaction center protein [Phtheirospermum japonicum]